MKNIKACLTNNTDIWETPIPSMIVEISNKNMFIFGMYKINYLTKEEMLEKYGE